MCVLPQRGRHYSGDSPRGTCTRGESSCPINGCDMAIRDTSTPLSFRPPSTLYPVLLFFCVPSGLCCFSLSCLPLSIFPPPSFGPPQSPRLSFPLPKHTLRPPFTLPTACRLAHPHFKPMCTPYDMPSPTRVGARVGTNIWSASETQGARAGCEGAAHFDRRKRAIKATVRDALCCVL